MLRYLLFAGYSYGICLIYLAALQQSKPTHCIYIFSMSVAFPFRVYGEQVEHLFGFPKNWQLRDGDTNALFFWPRQPSTSLAKYNGHHTLLMWETKILFGLFACAKATAESSVLTYKAYSTSSSKNLSSKTVF